MSEDDLKYFYERLTHEQELRKRSDEVAAGTVPKRFATMYRRRIEELEALKRLRLAHRPPIFDLI